jgi:hypothetical protein
MPSAMRFLFSNGDRYKDFAPTELVDALFMLAQGLSPITPSTRPRLACFELVEKLRAGLSLFTSHAPHCPHSFFKAAFAAL